MKKPAHSPICRSRDTRGPRGCEEVFAEKACLTPKFVPPPGSIYKSTRNASLGPFVSLINSLQFPVRIVGQIHHRAYNWRLHNRIRPFLSDRERTMCAFPCIFPCSRRESSSLVTDSSAIKTVFDR